MKMKSKEEKAYFLYYYSDLKFMFYIKISCNLFDLFFENM